jgi:hypothetical protein
MVLDDALRRALDRDPSLAEMARGEWGFRLRKRNGSRNPELYITDLVYADDIVLLAPSFEVAQRMLDAVIRETSLAGLQINVDKTKVLVRGDLVRSEGEVRVGDVVLERVEDFKYLGSQIGSVDLDVQGRCRAASRAFGRLMPVWKSPMAAEVKLRAFKAMVEPILFYGCETWALTDGKRRTVVGHWFRLVRQIVNRRWPRVFQSNEAILEEFKLSDPAKLLATRLLKHYGHALRTSQREKSAGVKLSPLSMVVQWSGEHGWKCTARNGMVRERYVLRRGKGNLCTLPSYCLRLLGFRNDDLEELQLLAQKKETWRRLSLSPSLPTH